MIPYVISCKSIKEARYKVVKHIMDNGKLSKDERGDKVRYYKHVIVVIPCNCCEDSDDKITALCDSAFAQNLITGKPVCLGENVGSDVQEPEYSYGQELHEDNGLEHTIQKLKDNPESRRVVNPLFKTKHYGKVDVPCMTILIWDIEAEDDGDYLNLTILGRSNETAIAMKSDIKGYAELLKYVAERVGVLPGNVLLHDVNAHVRVGSDLDEIKRILKEGY